MFEILSRFFNFCDPENRRKFYLAIAVGVFNSFFTALRIGAVAVMFQGIIRHLQEGVPFGTDTLWLTAGILLVSLTGGVLTKKSMTMLQTEGGYRACALKRIQLAEHLRYLPMGYFNANSLGHITSVATNTLEMLGSVAVVVVMMVMQGILDTVLIIAMIAVFDWRIAAVALAGLLCFQFINTLMRLNLRRISGEKIESDTQVVEKILEYVQGIVEVRSYNLTGPRSRDLNEAIVHNVQINTRAELKCVPLIGAQLLAAKLTGVAITLASIRFYLNGTMDLSSCAVVLVCAFMLFTALESGGKYSALLRLVDLSVERINAILALPTMDIEGKEIAAPDHTITAEDVVFSYDKKKIIDGISLTIPAQTTAAFVGPSGGGKTTLCHLLARFWDVDSGVVRFGGTNVKSYSMDSLMKNFSFVFQHVYLFHDTVANNIRFGEPDAPMEKVIAVAQKACCHEFISRLPQGYDTVIGEGGATLSGGEKQRLSIARAMMKDAPVIILDEATANVDPENERDLMEAIEQLTQQKTVLMIAHRLKTVRRADKILVIDKGAIAEQGRHKELMQNNGIYRRFIESRREAVSWKL